MKSVLISIQPKWCELIANGKKTVEVRKTKPKLPTPFKCYIYQTRKTWVYNIYSRIADWQSKVIGEFVCDSITEWCVDPQSKGYFITMDELALTQLTYEQLHEYGNGQALYGWHISDLVIYDKPKSLRKFKKCNYPYDCCACGYWDSTYLTCHREIRPPQSWCYVEVLQ